MELEHGLLLRKLPKLGGNKDFLLFSATEAGSARSAETATKFLFFIKFLKDWEAQLLLISVIRLLMMKQLR